MKNNNRWIIVLGAVLIQACIGAVYSWSLFNQPLIDKFGFSKTSVVFTFSITVFVFAFTTIFSGRLLLKIGPKKVSMIGGLFYGLGLILTSTATTLFQLYIYYGIIAAIGIGFCYVAPLATCIKWFPDKKGLITGITVGAFGLGSLIFEPIIMNLLSSIDVSKVFLYLGFIYLIFILIGAQLLKFPTLNSISQNSTSTNKTENYTISQMIKTKTFPILWVTYLLATMSGLLVIGLAKDIGVTLAGLTPTVAANIVSIIALFNAGGRLFWGALSDKLGRTTVIAILFIITAISMFYLSFINLHLISFFITVSSIAFCFGGFLAIYPVITGDLYGIKNLSANYSIVYQAYGISALVGPIIAANSHSLIFTFLISAILSLVGLILIFCLKKVIKV